jgi:hypothetical protein
VTHHLDTVRLGATGTAWRGEVGRGGEIVDALDWWIAADDRWHDPPREPSVRQRRLRGAPVVETKVKVPGGDVVQTVYVVPDDGGLTVVHVANESPSPCAIAFAPRRLLSSRLPTDIPDGSPVPPNAVAYPLPHRQTLTVAIAHDGRVGGAVPAVPSAEQVAAGWAAHCARGMRVETDDDAMAAGFVTARSTIVLDGPDVAGIDAAERLLRSVEWVRLGEPAEPLVDMVASDASIVARDVRDRSHLAALRAAREVLRVAGETRAVQDLDAIIERTGSIAGAVTDDLASPLDPAAAAGRWLAARRSEIVADDGARIALFPIGVAPGRNVAVHDVPLERGRVSAAIRWHGDRPALLWDATGDVTITVPSLDRAFSTDSSSGEALLSNR